MRRAALLASVVAVLSLVAPWDTARAEEARVYIGVYGGLAFSEDLQDGRRVPSGSALPDLDLAGFGDDDDHKLDGTIMGGKVGFLPEPEFTWFGLEAEVFVAPNRVKGGQPFGDEELTIVTVGFNSILRIPKGPIQPYVGAGPSLVWSDGIGGPETAFGLNLLVGTRIYLGGRLFLFGEAKRNESTMEFPAARVKVRQQGIVAGIALTF